MNLTSVEKIVNITKNEEVEVFNYPSSVFTQNAIVNEDGDVGVIEREMYVNLKLGIPVKTFEAYISTLLELREEFNVACAYSTEPISYENYYGNQESVVQEAEYKFPYWCSSLGNVLYSTNNQATAFIYVKEFKKYVNLSISKRKNKRFD